MRFFKPLMHILVIVIVGLMLSAPIARAATSSEPNRIRVEYVTPASSEHLPIYEKIKERHALEKLQEIFGAFRLPMDLTLRTVECDGVPNAWYQRGQVSVCYEYLAEMWKVMNEPSTGEIVEPADALVGQFFYVMAHEMGHAMFDLLDVPILGRPEDAADQFATYIILHFGKDQAQRLIRGAAYSYKKYLLKPKVTAPLAAFSDAHSPPATRFYNILCLAYGADPVLFAEFTTENYLPKQRATSCKREYGEVAYAFKKLITPHVDKGIAEAVLQKAWLPPPDQKPSAH